MTRTPHRWLTPVVVLALALLALVQGLALSRPRSAAAAAPVVHSDVVRRPAVVALPAPRVRAHRVRVRPAAPVVRAAAATPPRPVRLRSAVPRSAAVRPAAETAQQIADRRGRAALASLAFDPRRTGYSVVFRPGQRGLLGLTDPSTSTVTVYVRPGESDLVLRASLAHELGHAWDFSHYTRARHDAWVQSRHLDPSAAWAPGAAQTDYAYGAGDMAEVFALWLVGPGDFRSTAAPQPTPAQLQELSRQFA